jgi:hypothetical protein
VWLTPPPPPFPTLQVVTAVSSSIANALFADSATGRLWLSEEEGDTGCTSHPALYVSPNAAPLLAFSPLPTLQVVSAVSSSIAEALFPDTSTGRLWLSEEEEDSRELGDWRRRRCKPLLHKLMERRNMTLKQVGYRCTWGRTTRSTAERVQAQALPATAV